MLDRLRTILGRARADPPYDPGAQRAFFTGALAENLEEASRENGFGPLQRAAWLANHLEIYVHRCNGFAAVGGTAAVREGSFFLLVEIGAEALRREMDGFDAPTDAEEAWRHFAMQLDRTRTSDGFAPLVDTAVALHAAFATAAADHPPNGSNER